MAAPSRDFTAPTVQLLTPEGDLRPTPEAEGYLPVVEALADTELEQFYRDMVLSRRLDVMGANMQRQGQLALWVPSHGQEAAQVGSIRAARPQDHIFPSYREHIVGMIRGLDPVGILRLLKGATLGELHIIARRGTVARRGATRNTKGATIASEMILRPIEPPEGDDIWRDSDGRRYNTQSLVAKCMALLLQQATTQ